MNEHGFERDVKWFSPTEEELAELDRAQFAPLSESKLKDIKSSREENR